MNIIKGVMNNIDIEKTGDGDWLTALNEEDRQFLKRFLLSSGSLKAVAREYNISYPTVRARLDRLIKKTRVAESSREFDIFEQKLRLLVADGAVYPSIARNLLEAHRKTLEKGEDNDEIN